MGYTYQNINGGIRGLLIESCFRRQRRVFVISHTNLCLQSLQCKESVLEAVGQGLVDLREPVRDPRQLLVEWGDVVRYLLLDLKQGYQMLKKGPEELHYNVFHPIR
jgi:hypothetical protein